MKKLSILCICIISLSATFAQDKNALDEENGFRGHKFGDSISTFTNMEFLFKSDDGLVEYYTKTNDILVYGDSGKFYFKNNNELLKHEFHLKPMKLENIMYEFYKGKFYSVKLNVKENDSYYIDGVYQLAKHYGYCYQSAGGYYWDGKLVRTVYNSGERNKYYIYFISIPLEEALNKETKLLKKKKKK